MAISTGSRLGPYEIKSPLGAGGMGEVYKARDTRLDRVVAIKVLPPVLAFDSEFRARFDREARAISQLAHPNICALYDVGEHQGSSFLVMEHLDGETLASRLDRGAMKPEDAVRIGIEIAEALAAAHRAGIIHRDLKPANVFLIRGSGSDSSAHAKLLDFGLAKTAPAIVSSGADGMTVQPTVASPLTQQGTILGTFQYMAPEQVEGGEADARSDIWAFGCLMYEMLTGARAFSGKSHASLIANILQGDPPPIHQRQPLVSPTLNHVVQRCLEKDPEARWQTVVDVGRELRWAAAASSDGVAEPRRRLGRSSTAAWTVAAALVGASAAVAVMMMSRAPAVTGVLPSMKLTILPPSNLTMTPFGSFGTPHFALSPDGQLIAFVASAPGRSPSLWVRPLDARGVREIPGSDDASSPFWSPDGRALGFFSEGKLKTIGLNGDRPSILASVGDNAGATWSNDVILVGQGAGPIMRVAASAER